MSVDLPLPDNPMMQKISPLFRVRVTLATPTTQPNSFSTSVLPSPRSVIARIATLARLPKTFQTDRQSISGRLPSAIGSDMSPPIGTSRDRFAQAPESPSEQHRPGLRSGAAGEPHQLVLMFSHRLMRSAWFLIQLAMASSIDFP